MLAVVVSMRWGVRGQRLDLPNTSKMMAMAERILAPATQCSPRMLVRLKEGERERGAGSVAEELKRLHRDGCGLRRRA
jgi:hypothetical protein